MRRFLCDRRSLEVDGHDHVVSIDPVTMTNRELFSLPIGGPLGAPEIRAVISDLCDSPEQYSWPAEASVGCRTLLLDQAFAWKESMTLKVAWAAHHGSITLKTASAPGPHDD
jgi:hypothetical protein